VRVPISGNSHEFRDNDALRILTLRVQRDLPPAARKLAGKIPLDFPAVIVSN
jgi:hypothetical protein